MNMKNCGRIPDLGRVDKNINSKNNYIYLKEIYKTQKYCASH